MLAIKPFPFDAVIRRTRGLGLRRRLISIGHLTSGNFMNAGIMLISAGIAARALGPANYGVMVLVLAFCRTIERICRFESWQPLIKFAADLEVAGRPAMLPRLFAYGLLFDAVAAFIATMLIFALASLAGPVFGIASQHTDLIFIYALAILVNYTGMPTAALRIAGRFRTIAYSQLLANVVRIAMAMWCWHMQAGLYGFIIAWTIAQIIGAAIFFILAMRALRDQGISSPLKQSVTALQGQFPGFVGFAFSTNLSMTMRTLTTEADTLLVGALAGAPAAGFYQIAKRFAKTAQQVGAQVQAVMYPEVARMWAKGKTAKVRATTLHIQAALGAVGVTLLALAWLGGAPLIQISLGDAYASSYPLLLTQLVAVILTMHAAPSRSALLAMNKARPVLAVATLGTAIFFITAFVLIPRFGPMGANLAQIALAATIAVALDILWLRATRPVPDIPPPS